MEQLLEQLGFTAGEAAVYLALLERESATAAELAVAAKLKRPDTYNKLTALIGYGLATSITGPNGRQRFRVEHPQRLQQFVEAKRQSLRTLGRELDAVIPDMVSRYQLASHRPGVSVFQGAEAVDRVLADSLTAESVIDSYLDGETALTYIAKENAAYVKEREALRKRKRILIVDSPISREFVSKGRYSEFTEYRFATFPLGRFHTVMQIYDDKVSYLTLKPEAMIGVIIQDKLIADLHRNVFQLTWNQVPPLVQR